ncbi:hypothetical protein FOCC_FOCC008718 [Frankliniella occidentalis]|nr:hypothetical protein FOCC_FOCC008718 [Frankliniella occidentalis]
MEQYSRSRDVEISGIPETEGECLSTIMTTLANKMGNPSITNDIDVIHQQNTEVYDVYINEHLTPFMKDLLWKTKTAAREAGHTMTWYKNNKKLVKKDKKIITIKNESDIAAKLSSPASA